MTTADSYITSIRAIVDPIVAAGRPATTWEDGRQSLARQIQVALSAYDPQRFREGDRVHCKAIGVEGVVLVAERADDGYGRWIYEVHDEDEGDVYSIAGDELEYLP